MGTVIYCTYWVIEDDDTCQVPAEYVMQAVFTYDGGVDKVDFAVCVKHLEPMLVRLDSYSDVTVRRVVEFPAGRSSAPHA